VKALPIVDNAPSAYVPGPKEQALQALWPKARARLDTIAYWRETVRLRRRFSLKMLRIDDLKVAIPRGRLPDCESCLDVCCTGPNAVVSLRLRDIAALADAGLDRFVVHERAVLGPQRAKATWARREADGSVFHRAFPVLRRDQTGTCALLTEERTCGAFPAWPLSCARYPYALDLQTKHVFWATGCGSMTTVPAMDAPVRVRALLHAVIGAYNERVKDAVLVHVARNELEELDLARHIDWAQIM
jgi:hypothetical protein